MKKITIVTASYNQGQYIEGTIKSILGQNYPNLEYIIIDGGSTDNSVDIIRKYEKDLTYWVSEKDRGQSHAINKGFEKATGEIITWINSDDQLLPGALNTVNDYFQKHKDISLIHGKTILYDNKNLRRVTGGESFEVGHRYLAGIPFPQPSSFFKREVLDDLGNLNEELHYGMDYDLVCRIALNRNLMMVDDVFSNYLFHDESKSVNDNDEFANDWARIFSKVLRSIPNTESIVKEMEHLNLYYPDDSKFTVTKQFDEVFMKRVFLYFLLNQVIFRYQALEMGKTNEVLSYLKRNHPDFFNQNDLNKTYWRSKYPVMKKIISLYRRFIR